jgi:hypothetical protein
MELHESPFGWFIALLHFARRNTAAAPPIPSTATSKAAESSHPGRYGTDAVRGGTKAEP